MLDYIEFVSKPKSLLVAPAGYGKTHTIAECLKYTDGTQLILTHTHAGVASLKEKITEIGISSKKYNVETIDSFAQKYVLAFYCGGDTPEQENGREYFPFIIQKATSLVKINAIKKVIKASYAGLFVDEYQDCTKNQHKFILALSNLLPTRILGDPLQGIFGFNDQELVNWDTDLNEFNYSRYELNEPWRWKSTNMQLGNDLKTIRERIRNGAVIDLNDFESSIDILQVRGRDIYNGGKEYNKKIWNLLNTENSLLVICPSSENINARIKIIKQFNNRFQLVEAMDGNDLECTPFLGQLVKQLFSEKHLFKLGWGHVT